MLQSLQKHSAFDAQHLLNYKQSVIFKIATAFNNWKSGFANVKFNYLSCYCRLWTVSYSAAGKNQPSRGTISTTEYFHFKVKF